MYQLSWFCGKEKRLFQWISSKLLHNFQRHGAGVEQRLQPLTWGYRWCSHVLWLTFQCVCFHLVWSSFSIYVSSGKPYFLSWSLPRLLILLWLSAGNRVTFSVKSTYGLVVGFFLSSFFFTVSNCHPICFSSQFWKLFSFHAAKLFSFKSVLTPLLCLLLN